MPQAAGHYNNRSFFMSRRAPASRPYTTMLAQGQDAGVDRHDFTAVASAFAEATACPPTCPPKLQRRRKLQRRGADKSCEGG